MGTRHKPWREIAVPHKDVATGKYKKAEFAADLAQVLSGNAEPEYQNSTEFFLRTYITDGMQNLLVAAAERLAGKGGEPVIQLKTAFGGGKTHSMLALFHLFGDEERKKHLPGTEVVLSKAGVRETAKAKIAVLVGTALNPTKPRKHPKLKSRLVRTLWGEMAAQLGGDAGYDLVSEADESGVSPGSDDLVELFDKFGPALILVDELIAYCRSLYGLEKALPAGSFDTNMTFVQALTEAAKRSKQGMVVAAIPESDIEVGGAGGQAALDRIGNTFRRLEAVWKPVGTEEGFEIVRRRLFQPIKDEEGRDAICRAFSFMYVNGAEDFPAQAREGAYFDRMKKAYPIHPEVFDRLYDDWSALEKFQKTRGVLRFLATVIHQLWVDNDQSFMILPGSIPLGASKVRDELLVYLPDGWQTVVEKDVDGERSEPYQIDSKNPRLGAISAARRVARAVFIGSAPSVKEQRIRGIEEVRVKLGVVQPGDSIPVFVDALKTLQDRLTHLYAGSQRLWYDIPPNLRRTVEDRASQLNPADVDADIERRLRAVKERGEFCGVHVAPDTADVPDEQEVRLVILGPDHYHRSKVTDTPALARCAELLDKRGGGPRQFKNTLAFVAPDGEGVDSLRQEVRRFLAWKSVEEEKEALNLDAHQQRQAKENRDRSDQTVEGRLREAWSWLIYPTQEGAGELRWQSAHIRGTDSHVVRASRTMVKDEQLITKWNPLLLRMELDKWLWKDADHVGLKEVWEKIAKYCYFPRLKDQNVLLEAVREGMRSSEHFGYAQGVDGGKYRGLSLGQASASVFMDGSSVLVKPDAAQRALAEKGETKSRPTAVAGSLAPGTSAPPQRQAGTAGVPAVRPTNYHGSVSLKPGMIAGDAIQIAKEVVQHLVGLMGSEVEVTLEIRARVPDGVPDSIVRTVTENCRTLKFTSHGFE